MPYSHISYSSTLISDNNQSERELLHYKDHYKDAYKDY